MNIKGNIIDLGAMEIFYILAYQCQYPGGDIIL